MLPKNDITLKKSYLLLISILIFSSVLSLIFFQGMSVWGDDPSYALLLPSIYHGAFNETSNIFSVRPALLYPLAFFSKALGFSDFAAGFYAFVCYLLSIVVTFLIGREIYSNKGGLLGSLFFAVYPGVIKANSTAESLLPLVFFLGLAVLLFIYGRKFKSKWLYAFSGVSTFIGAMANPLGYIYVIFFAVYTLLDFIRCFSAKKTGLNYDNLTYFAGFTAAVLIMGLINLHLAYNGNPFYEISSTSSYFSTGAGQVGEFLPNSSFTYYVYGFFPYTFNNASSFYEQAFTARGVALGLVPSDEIGFFGYFALLFGIYLLATRNKKYYFLLGWAAFIIGYLEFGTMSVTHYQTIFKVMRYGVIALIPLALVLSFGILDLGDRLFRKHIFSKRVFIWSIVIFLFVTTLPLDYYYYAFNHNSMVYPKLIAESLLKAPSLSNSSLYGPVLTTAYVLYDMGYPQIKSFGVYGNGKNGTSLLPSCGSIPNDTYLIIPNNQTLSILNAIAPLAINESWASDPSECNLILYANLSNSPQLNNLYYGETILTGNIYYKK
jgi:4-amino-4-deoxy-L-arabinose transferase-like glycosyltransferase